MLNAQDIPYDLLTPIISHLDNRADWWACCLVSRLFNKAATPLLYRNLDSREISKSLLYHPATTLKEKPELAQFVRSVTETGAVHRGLLPRYPNITQDVLFALSLCTNVQSLTWIDDSSSPTDILLLLLSVIRNFSLRRLTIRTHSTLGEPVWVQLITLSGLRKVSIWCMEGPPRVLQGWSNTLGKTLTHLELGVSSFNLTTCPELLSQFPLLTYLRLKGAPSSYVLSILSRLPNLRSFDVEYLPSPTSSSSSFRRTQSAPVHGHSAHSPPPPMPILRTLTVRTMMDSLSPQKLWTWIHQMAPRAGLQKLKLHAFSLYPSAFSIATPTFMDQTIIPRMFMTDFVQAHKKTLKCFEASEAGVITMGDVEFLCESFPELEVLQCTVVASDVTSIAHAVQNAHNLSTLRMQIQRVQHRNHDPQFSNSSHGVDIPRFTAADARNMMLRSEQSKLRVIAVGSVRYTGKWILNYGVPTFEVTEKVEEDKWHT